MPSGSVVRLWLVFGLMIFLNGLVWLSVRDVKARWANAPPAPEAPGMRAFALGDAQFAYRQTGIMLQNLGNAGGRSEPFANYDYFHLRDWFFLARALDSRSVFVPYLAAYYFGAVEDPAKIPPLVEYLRAAGNAPQSRSWRWLAQAVYLARYKENNLDKAYELAVELADIQDPTLPVWAKQMPAFVLTAKGDKQGAYDILLSIMRDSSASLPPQEINVMREYICERVLDHAQAKDNPLCKDQNETVQSPR